MGDGADDMVDKDTGESGPGIEITLFIVFASVLFCYPIFRWVRARYINSIESKVRASLTNSVSALRNMSSTSKRISITTSTIDQLNL